VGEHCPGVAIEGHHQRERSSLAPNLHMGLRQSDVLVETLERRAERRISAREAWSEIGN
jgi:hypothetical protein